MPVKSYRCPICKKRLTKQEHERARGILSEREKHLAHQKAELQMKLREARKTANGAKQEGIKAERARTQRLLKGKDKQIQSLKERIDQPKKGSTPQTDGLEFEEKLAARLQDKFPQDDIQHKSKAGDVLQVVKFGRRRAGLIVYKCKRTPRIQIQHVRQADRALQTGQADFAVLVTTGQRKGFTGLANIEGVLVVSPLGAIPLAALLRDHLVEMLRARTYERALWILSQREKHLAYEKVELQTKLRESGEFVAHSES